MFAAFGPVWPRLRPAHAQNAYRLMTGGEVAVWATPKSASYEPVTGLQSIYTFPINVLIGSIEFGPRFDPLPSATALIRDLSHRLWTPQSQAT